MQATSEEAAVSALTVLKSSHFRLFFSSAGPDRVYTGSDGDVSFGLTFGHKPPNLFGNVQPSPDEHEHAANCYAHLLQHQLQHTEALKCTISLPSACQC